MRCRHNSTSLENNYSICLPLIGSMVLKNNVTGSLKYSFRLSISCCHSGIVAHASYHLSTCFWNASGFLYSVHSEEALYCPSLFQTRLNATRLQPCLDRSEKKASPYSSQKLTQSIRWASAFKGQHVESAERSIRFISYGLPTPSSKQQQCFDYSVLAHDVMGRMVLVER